MGQDQKESLAALEERIHAARHRDETKASSMRRDISAYNKGITYTLEFVSGALVGGFLGYYLDQWLGTLPVFFIICLILGLAASVLNIYKQAARESEVESSQGNTARSDDS